MAEAESWFDDTSLVDPRRVMRGRHRESAECSLLVGHSGYDYRNSHSRYFCGFRHHLPCTAARPPVTTAMAVSSDDEDELLRDLIGGKVRMSGHWSGRVIVAVDGFYSAENKAYDGDHGAAFILPAMVSIETRHGGRFLKTFCQFVESMIDALKDQLDMEQPEGCIRERADNRVP